MTYGCQRCGRGLPIGESPDHRRPSTAPSAGRRDAPIGAVLEVRNLRDRVEGVVGQPVGRPLRSSKGDEDLAAPDLGDCRRRARARRRWPVASSIVTRRREPQPSRRGPGDGSSRPARAPGRRAWSRGGSCCRCASARGRPAGGQDHRIVGIGPFVGGVKSSAPRRPAGRRREAIDEDDRIAGSSSRAPGQSPRPRVRAATR